MVCQLICREFVLFAIRFLIALLQRLNFFMIFWNEVDYVDFEKDTSTYLKNVHLQEATMNTSLKTSSNVKI
jgi:hypothetical protein